MKQTLEQNGSGRGKSDASGIGLLIMALAIVTITFSAVAPQHIDLVTAMPEFSHYRVVK